MKIKAIIEKIIVNEVLIGLFIFLIVASFIIVPGIIMGRYGDVEYLDNLLLEAHGMIFDLLVIGVFSTWLIKRGQRRSQIQQYKDEIDDFRNWYSEEASYRILGSIKRLNKLKETKINLSNCYLAKINLKHVDLSGSELYQINLKEAFMEQSKFDSASLTESNLQSGKLRWSNFKGARLGYADFSACDLRDSNFEGADFYRANLGGANMRGANLRVARNITAKQLLETKSLFRTVLDDQLQEEIMKIKPELLLRPEKENLKIFKNEKPQIQESDNQAG